MRNAELSFAVAKKYASTAVDGFPVPIAQQFSAHINITKYNKTDLFSRNYPDENRFVFLKWIALNHSTSRNSEANSEFRIPHSELK